MSKIENFANELFSIYSNFNHSPSGNSLPDDDMMEDQINDFDDDPLESILRRGRRNTTGQNFGYLNCHPKYWADILPVPSKLIKMLWELYHRGIWRLTSRDPTLQIQSKMSNLT